MGRFTKMAAAEPPEDPDAERKRLIEELEKKTSAGNVVSHKDIADLDRYRAMLKFSIKQPDSDLARDAIVRAATVWVCTDFRTPKQDEDAVKFLANYLFTEGLYWGHINEARALPREIVDNWLTSESLSPTSARIYRSLLYQAGRVLYPREYPKPYAPTAKRARALKAVTADEVKYFYAAAAAIGGGLGRRLTYILDLSTAAGLRSEEIRDLKGKDFSEITLADGRSVVIIAVRRRGTLNRRVPVTCPARQQRMMARAREVGTGYFFPTAEGGRPPVGAVANTFAELRTRGYKGAVIHQLRNRWLLDMVHTRIPAAALAGLCGPGLFRAIADHVTYLRTYTTEELAEMMLEEKP